MDELTEREREVVWLKEGEHLSFQKIADRYGISRSRAAQIFTAADRKRRAAHKKEMQQERNSELVTITVTRGDLRIISDLLQEYSEFLNRGIYHGYSEMHRLHSDPRFQNACRISTDFWQLAEEAPPAPKEE